MGQEIKGGAFSAADREEFHRRLRSETALLKRWFDERAFDVDEGYTVGLELEGWLIDQNHLPTPDNDAFFDATDHPDIVAELSRFNFEINAPPRTLAGNVLTETLHDLQSSWTTCQTAADTLGIKPVAIGILPTVRDEMLQLGWMSDTNRYHALNRELFARRKDKPLHILIEGQDRLDYHCNHLMLEAACTSLQAHLKVNQDDAVRVYNAAIIAAAPLVAATANSPFLFGKSLWKETRIPAFEQATALDGFRDVSGRNVKRVTLGTGYLRQSFLELFLENLSYPDLLPALEEKSADALAHLRLQNGTVWRWVRPIIGFDGDRSPHLRIEHRVMPAGPSLVDTVANLALCHGLVLALAGDETPPETLTSFEEARTNFYACARDGLMAEVKWAGRSVNVQSLLVDDLLPRARRALAEEGLPEEERGRFFHDVLEPRLRTGRTGAVWQRSFIDCNGINFQAMTERYCELQASGSPVHTWTI